MSIDYPTLPLSELREAFCAALTTGSLLLEAEPGAGKSTLAPLWVLDALPTGEVWLIQPRVLAAINLAARLAALLGERVGQSVGYQVPFERRLSQQTRLVLMTPGVLLQRLLGDPELSGVSCVLLDEIHERSVDQDTAWALLQETAILNEKLALVLMSATPDAALRRQVDTALFSPGRCFPVTLSYCAARQQARRPEAIAAHLIRALNEQPHWQHDTLLVFLSGWRDIEACHQQLLQRWPQLRVYRLHSRVERAEQQRALDCSQGPRVILATNIAETSLTIADVTLVVDSGQVREPDFEQRSGVTRLTTRRVSRASAEQRRGRAGRVQAGRCVRLWDESEPLTPQPLPAIRRSDYLPLALRLAHWGTQPEALPWLEAPNPQALKHAYKLLQRWQFVDKTAVAAGPGKAGDSWSITPLGRRVALLGTHPRTAALLLHTGADLRAHSWLLLLGLALHFDLPAASDLSQWLQEAGAEYRRNNRWRQLSDRWQRVLGVTVSVSAHLGVMSDALTDRLAGVLTERLGRRTASGRYRLNCGISVSLDCSADWAQVLHITRRGQEHLGVGFGITPSAARIRELAEARTTLEMQGSGHRRRWVEHCGFYLGGQLVDTSRHELAASAVPAAIMAQLKQQGLAQLHWSSAALSLLLRARWAAQLRLLTALPALDIHQLNLQMPSWLGGFIDAKTDTQRLPLAEALAFYLGFEVCKQLKSLVPDSVLLPSGRRVAVDYQGTESVSQLVAGEALPTPGIAGKLQEFFGTQQFAVGRVPFRLALLSPAGRPLAITQDLAYFWREVYPQVRREMRGRYIKHPWPENPLTHPATALVKRRL